MRIKNDKNLLMIAGGENESLSNVVGKKCSKPLWNNCNSFFLLSSEENAKREKPQLTFLSVAGYCLALVAFFLREEYFFAFLLLEASSAIAFCWSFCLKAFFCVLSSFLACLAITCGFCCFKRFQYCLIILSESKCSYNICWL